MNIHRPFSALTYSAEELSARSFTSHIPLIGPQRQSRSAHTARALKAAELQTKLLAIPCQAEKHPLFTACIAAAIAVAEISACNVLLDGHALSIARDRIRLTIGFLRQMGTVWPLAKHMADEVKYVARSTLASASVSRGPEPDPAAVIELPRDELIYPVHPYSQIDIYSGIVLPPWEDASDQTFLSTPSTMS
jgi:nicotinate-nucleotide pyrophosphorylase (carboxylating)